MENYVKALEVAGLGRMLLNSVVVGLVATLINVVIASMSGYCISRFNFRGKEKMMVPYFVIINKLGLYNTYGGLILLWYHKLLALRGRRLFSGPGGYRGHGGSSPKQEDRSGNGLRLPSFPGGDGLSGDRGLNPILRLYRAPGETAWRCWAECWAWKLCVFKILPPWPPGLGYEPGHQWGIGETKPSGLKLGEHPGPEKRRRLSFAKKGGRHFLKCLPPKTVKKLCFCSDP